MKIGVDLIKIDEECYPRPGGLDNAHLQVLQAAGKLPPIEVNQDMFLVDGKHRLTLAKMQKLPEVEVKIVNIPRDKILERAAQLNAKHGLQLTLNDKRFVVRRLSQDGHEVSALASLLGLSRQTVNKWTSDIRATRVKDRNEQILDLYLEGHTEAEIARKLALSRQTASGVIVDAKKAIENRIGIPDPPQIGDVWFFANCDDSYGLAGYPGRIPGQIVENLLHLYTEPFDLIVDPMAGSGTTLDVCKTMHRRCLAYDLKVVRDGIKENDIRGGFPPGTRGSQLVLLDPPYYKKKDEAYYPGSISRLGREEYLQAFGKLARDAYRVLRKGGYLALVISNYVDEDNPRESIWVWDYIPLFKQAKLTPIREIHCPLTTQSLHPGHVKDFQDNRRMAKFTRSVVVFKCK